MSGLYLERSWLPRPPADFAAACKALAAAAAPGAACAHLAGHALDENQLARLGRAIIRLRQAGHDLAPLQPFRLGLLGHGTLDLLAPVLAGAAAGYGLALDCVQAEYGQLTQAALDPASAVNAAKPDAALLALDHRSLPLGLATGDLSQASAIGDLVQEQAAIAAAIAQIGAVRTGLHTHAGAVCLVPTVPPPPETLFGSFDRRVPGTPRRVIEALNGAIADSLAGSQDVLLDVAALAETVGLGTWHAPAQWAMAKLAFADVCLPIYADHVARLLAALRGRSRRCLILDLDNTLWGGVVGDDGVAGLRLGQGDPVGEAHLSLQQMALRLRARGIVLAVCSKNTDAMARAPFREHPDMLLKEDSFAVFQANWDDKASNIRAIAKALLLGLDAMVFLDDSPMERDLVRRMLPQVAVPELPDDPALYSRLLAAAGYFEATAFSDEDRGRAAMYQSNARRVAVQSATGNLDAYLASLGMEIAFAPFDRAGRTRIAQLINKSNQFNLTTRRYTEAEIAAAEADPAVFTLQARLVDVFGDNGMVSVVICRPGPPSAWEPGAREHEAGEHGAGEHGAREHEAGEHGAGEHGAGEHGAWEIDTWLMSCRVLGRRVEHAVLREILLQARSAGVSRLIGLYRPTERNALVRGHYPALGFDQRAEQPDGTTVWALDVQAEIAPAPIAVRRSGFALAPA